MNIGKKSLLQLIGIAVLIAQDPMTDFSRGEEELNLGNLEAAENLFQNALDADPTFAPAMVGLARVNLRKGNMEQTQKYFREAIDTDPENQEFRDEFERVNEINTLMNQGIRSIRNGEPEEALETYRIVLERFPFFAEAAYNMGLAKFRMQDFTGAVEHFKATLKLNPYHENALTAIKNVAKNTFNDGNNAYRRGDLEGAINSYKKVLEVDETFYQAYYQIGVIEAKMGNSAEAISQYDRALKIEPGFYKGWFALGLVKKNEGDAEGAISALNQAIVVNPGYAKAYGAIGDIHLDNRDYEEAAEIFTTVTQIDPGYAKGHIGLGVVYLDQEQFEQAIPHLETASTLNQKDAMVWFRLASSYNGIQDCENAKRSAREATEIKSKFGGGWHELGVAEWCNGRGNKTAALNALERGRNDRSWRNMCEYMIDRVRNPHKYEN